TGSLRKVSSMHPTSLSSFPRLSLAQTRFGVIDRMDFGLVGPTQVQVGIQSTLVRRRTILTTEQIGRWASGGDKARRLERALPVELRPGAPQLAAAARTS